MISAQRYRWIIVAYSLVIQAVCVGILIYCFALFSLPWLDEFGSSRRDVMITISGLQLAMGIVSPFVGRAMDRYAMRNIVLLGVVLLALGLWLCQLATALWQIWLIYATVMPLATVMMGTLAAQTLVTKWFVQQRGLALGLSALGTNVGGLILPLMVAALIVDAGWRQTFNLLALMALGLVVPLTLLILRREPPEHSRIHPARGEPDTPSPPTQAPTNTPTQTPAESLAGRVWTSREILSTRLFWLPFLALVPLNMAFGALQFNLGGLVRDIGASDESTAALITISALGMVLGKLFCGALGDRIDHRVLFWLANGVMCIAIGQLLVAEDYPGLMRGVAGMGLAGGGLLPMMGLIFSARFGVESFGRVMGFVMLSVMLGGLAPVIAGWTYDVSGSYDTALWGVYVITLPAVVAMKWLPTPEQARKLHPRKLHS